MRTIKVMVVLEEIRVNDPEDDEEVKEAVSEALQEAIEDDTLDYSVEDADEEN